MRTSRIVVLLGAVLIHAFPAKAATPAPPQNVQPAWIYEGPATYARLTWSASEGATSYNIYRFNDTATNWIQIATGLTNLMHFDYGTPSTPKSYVVTAANGDGESVASEIATALDGDPISVLHQSPSEFPDPFQRYGWVTPKSARIIWLLPQTSGADGMLEFGGSATNLEIVYFQPAYQLFGHGITLTNLTPATQYYYRITSVGTNRVGVATLHSLATPDTNHPPVAGSTTFSSPNWPGEYSIPLTVTDTDSYSLTPRLTIQPTNGTVTGLYQSGPSGPFSAGYLPNPGARGGDYFEYVVNDGELDSAPGLVTVTNLWMNRAPQTTSFDTNLLEDSSIELVLSVYDVDGDQITFIDIGSVYGTVTGMPPNVTYTPPTNYNGPDWIVYSVIDGYDFGFAQGVINIAVLPANDVPAPSAQSIETYEDTSVVLGLPLADVDGDPIIYSVATGPDHGTVSGTASNFTYTPYPNYFGTDAFTYRASDGTATSAVATVTLTVNGVNDAPVADSQTVTLSEDTSANIALTGSDLESSVTYIIIEQPAHGTLTSSGAEWVYAPAPNFHGGDSFTFKANDGSSDSALATVALTVTPVNDAPSATPQSLVTSEDIALNLTLTGSDPENEPLSFAITSGPSQGSLSGNAPNLVYTPHSNYSGQDSFTFTVNDGALSSISGTISISVTSVNDAPSANAQSVTTSYNTPVSPALSGSDVEGSSLTYTVLSTPANGTLSGVAPDLTFTPNTGWSGTTSFAFRVSDGALDSAAATVTITVQPATAVPSAPTGLTATAVSNSQINLTWTDNSANNEDGFKIERSTNGSSWTQIGTVGRNVTNYSSTGLSSNKSYSYRVRAHNVLGNSPYSGTAFAKTLR